MSDDEAQGEIIDIPLPSEGDVNFALGEADWFAQLSEQDVRRRRLENDTIEDDNKQRRDYYYKSHGIIQSWIGFLIVLIISQFTLKPMGYSLATEEFIAVVVSLTGSVFGFWYLVGRYLFEPKRGNGR